MNNKSKVLNIYKALYKTRRNTFQGDTVKLNELLTHFRNEFRMNKDLAEESKIQEQIKAARDIERFLRTEILQTVKVKDKDHTFRLNIKDYMLTDNHVSEPIKGKK